MNTPIITRVHNVTRRAFIAVTAALTLGALTIDTAQAQTVAGIKTGGVLRAGVQAAQVPWGFIDASGKLTGYDIELVEMLAKELGVKPEFTPTTPVNRIAILLTGKVDLLAAVVGIFPDRQKVVLFSRPYSDLVIVWIAKAGPQWKGWEDLAGMRIGVPRGTPQEAAVVKANPSGATIQRFDDDSTTVQALISGQVDVIGAAIAQIKEIAKVAGPGKFESRLMMHRAFNGLAIRPGEREWLNYLNDFIGRKIASGELAALYKKWVGGDLLGLPTTGEGDAAYPIVFIK